MSCEEKSDLLNDCVIKSSLVRYQRLPTISSSKTKSTFPPHPFLRIAVLACLAIVLASICAIVIYMATVQKELIRLREDLVRLENCVVQLREDEDATASPQKDIPSSSDLIFYDSWIHEEGWKRSRSRRSSSSRSRREITGSDVGIEQEADMQSDESTNPKKAAKKRSEDGSKKGSKKEKMTTYSAVHFAPKNSSSRVMTTKRDSPVLDFWQPVKWSHMNNPSFYHIRDGTVTIREDGLYFIYVQLVFHDLSGRWSFSVNINDRQELKCINSEHISGADSHHPSSHGVYQHCFSSRVFHIRRLEQVTIRSLYEQRNILLSPEFTFWGIIKMQ